MILMHLESILKIAAPGFEISNLQAAMKQVRGSFARTVFIFALREPFWLPGPVAAAPPRAQVRGICCKCYFRAGFRTSALPPRRVPAKRGSLHYLLLAHSRARILNTVPPSEQEVLRELKKIREDLHQQSSLMAQQERVLEVCCGLSSYASLA